MIRTILIAVDDSAAAFHAADVAVELAASLAARLVAVSVVDGVLTRSVGGADAVRTGRALPEDTRREARAAQQHVRRLAERAGVQVDLVTEHGPVADQILAQARRTGADLLVVGRVDRPGVRLPHVGRTAEQVLEFSTVPVMVVPLTRGGR